MGRSLHSSEGILLYSAQTVFDTAVTPATPVSYSEFNATDEGDYRKFFTLGKANLHKAKAGIYKVDWQFRTQIATSAILARAVRASGQVPWTTFAFGSDPVDAASEAWQVQDCKVGALELSLDGGGVLAASFSGIGGLKTATTPTMSHASKAPLMSYEAVLTLATVAFEVKGFRFTVNHNLTPESVVRGTALASAKLRRWDYLTEGNEEIDGTIILARKSTKDMQAACPANDGDMVLTLTEACDGTNTFAITLTEVDFLSQGRNMPGDGYGSFELPFTAKGWSYA